ncbi:MAG: PAS domain S-box protein [Alphaproteobacteria bacterium]|nr:PAS domain S-box protein [Alphaproteobacteria bacterium]
MLGHTRQNLAGRRHAALLHASLGSVPAGVCVTDRRGLFVDANPQYCRLCGYERHELIGRHYSIVTPAVQPGTHERVFDRGEVLPAYWRVVRKDGAELIARALLAPFDDENGRRLKITTLLDIGERDSIDNERRVAHDRLVQNGKMAALGELVTGVAHELNTPIGVALTAASHLIGEVEALKRELAGGSLTRDHMVRGLTVAEAALSLVMSSVQRAGRLVEAFKQVAATHTEDGLHAVPLRQVLEGLLEARRMRHPGVHVVLDVLETCRPVTYAETLRRVLGNLLDNVFDHAFAPSGDAGTLRVESAETAESTVISIADDGVGIPPASLGKVFDPFFTSARGAGKTGLGLHIAYNLVTAVLGGDIVLDSRPGLGSRVTLTIPKVHVGVTP